MNNDTGFRKPSIFAEISKKISVKDYVVTTLAVGFFAFVVIKEVNIPKFLLVLMTLGAGVMLLFQGIAKPEVVIYALVAYVPFSKELAGDFGGLATAFNFTNLLVGFMLWAWMTGRFTARDNTPWVSTPLNLPIYIFLFLGFLSIFRANYYDASYIGTAIIEYKRWITPIIMFFLVLNTVRDRVTAKNVAVIIMITTTIVALMAIYDYIDQGDCGSLEKCRIGGITEQPNMLAAFFNYYMFLPFGFFLHNMSRFKYWSLWIPFLLCFRGIMVTFSRGGYLAFAVGLYAITFFRSRILFLLLLLAGYLISLNPEYLPAGIRYRMGQTFVAKGGYSNISAPVSTAALETSSKRRVDVWKAGIEMVKDNPIFGVGYGLFPYAIRGYWDGGSMDSHNTYLIIAAEMGLPTLGIFLLIIFILILQTLLLYIQTKDPFAKSFALGWLGGLFALLLSNMFGSRLDSQEVSSFLWIISALIFRFRRLDQLEKMQPPPAPEPDQPVNPEDQKKIPWFERKGAF